MTSELEMEIGAVIRLPDITSTREDVEKRLGVPLDRFEPYRRGAGHYGQVNAPGERLGGTRGLA